ncbi:hypothetical protein AAHH67_14870 [Niallia circulans]
MKSATETVDAIIHDPVIVLESMESSKRTSYGVTTQKIVENNMSRSHQRILI